MSHFDDDNKVFLNTRHNMKIDWDKPLRIKDGNEVELLKVVEVCGKLVYIGLLWSVNKRSYSIREYTSEGMDINACHISSNLENVPEEPVPVAFSYEDAAEIIGEPVRYGDVVALIGSVTKDGIRLVGYVGIFTFDDALNALTFFDGRPFGKIPE